MNSRVVGQKEAVRKIAAVRQRAVGILSDGEVSALLVSRIKARFMQGVAPSGTPWPGLMESTIARKQRGRGKKPNALLYETGRLYNSIKVIQGVNTGLLAVNTGMGFRIGVSDPIAAGYGRLHNYGLGGQEERRFMGLSRLDIVAVSGMLRRKMKSIAKV